MPNRDELRIAYALPDREIPRVRMNFVSSIDGAVTLGGLSGALGGEGDRRLMQVLRSMCDIVLVAAGTVRAEGYGGLRLETVDASWRESHGLPAQPRLAMVSRSLDVGAEHPFFAEATTRPIVVTCAAAPAERRAALAAVADVLVCGDAAVDLADALAQLAELGLAQVLCEGGPHLFGELAEAELVDEVCLTLSPLLVGGEVPRIVQGAPERGRQMRLVHALSDEDGFVFLRYRSALG
ncbi:MAG: pyrimidine reductase family protein [Microbacteriaceae bacterium]|jgi:riboflavin biosynthesis pyrimidine reductase|nr:pyrimidine reductase family protein [Microbacteriaceae bacterium]HPZ34885.1 pyrimidine reductase family protein [Microbacteriaceae bacterium]HQC92452.1 pyrimidine reductase family protein [Microbacteriaceae bacterium]